MRRHDAERTDDLQPRPDALGADALGATPRSRRWIRERSATSLEAEAGHDQQCVHVSIAPPGKDNGLVVLLDALDIVVISDTERASLTELAGFRRPPWIHRCR